MTPAENKYAMGVFNGKLQPVPYEATETYDPGSRYRRGIKFLTSLAKGEFAVEQEAVGRARDGLHLFQFIEAQWERFYNRNPQMKELIQGNAEGEFLGDVKVAGQVSPAEMIQQKSGIYEQLTLPSVNKKVSKMFQSFKGIEWKTDSENRIGHGRDLTNDHLFDFYNTIMSDAGKGKEFEEYRAKMNGIEAQMINNEIIDPVDYMSLRGTMDKQVMDIAQEVFIGGFANLGGREKFVRDIQSNPVFILMGGKDYFKGYSYEAGARRNLLGRLKNAHKLSTDFDNYKNRIRPETTEAKNEIEQLLNECGG